MTAMVFGSLCLGLNFQEIGPVRMDSREWKGGMEVVGSKVCSYYGWPLPFRNAYDDERLYTNLVKPGREGCVPTAEEVADADWWRSRWKAACTYEYPITHQAYRIANWGRLSSTVSVICVSFNIVCSVLVLSMVLFLQIRIADSKRLNHTVCRPD